LSLAALRRSRRYAHGSAIMNTLQQLAGAADTALLVAAMAIGATAATDDDAAEAKRRPSAAGRIRTWRRYSRLA
jgi:DHA2 family lincomycin resistance protein-like MFS transporter